MKILYLGTERSDAQAVATALRGVDHDVTLAHVVRLEDATRCLSDHQDVCALVIDAQTVGRDWSPLLAQARARALRPAVVVIVPEETAFDALRPDVDDYITRNSSLVADLPGVVTRAVARAREQQRADLEQRLAQANAALSQTEDRHAAAIAAADEKLSEQQAQYEIAMARAAATWDMVDEQLRVAALEVERARQRQAEAAAEAERLTERDAQLTTQLAGAVSARDALERRIAEIEAAAEAARTQAERDRIAANGRAAARERELEAHIATETDRRRLVDEQLEQAISAHTEAESRHTAAISAAAEQARELEEALRLVRLDVESKSADVDRLSTRSAELDVLLADVTAARNDLERKLSATQAAFEDATTRATRERLTASKRAADREAELDGQIRQERATRATLEQRIADADSALRDARQRHDEALAAAAHDRADLDAQFTRERSQLAGERDAIAQQLRAVQAALDRSTQDHLSAVTTIERLTQQQAELTGELATMRTANDSLAEQLRDVHATLERTTQEHASATATIERLSQRQTELTAELADVQAAREAVAIQLRDVQDALDRKTQDHASATATIERLSRRQTELTAELGDVQSARDALATQLRDVQGALDRKTQDHASATAAIERLSQRETELTGELADVQSARDALATQLRDVQGTLDRKTQDHASATAAIERLSQRATELTGELADVQSARDALATQLHDLQAALDRKTQDYESATATIDRLSQRQTELTGELADVQAARHSLELQLADSDAANRRAAVRETELESQLRQERDTVAGLTQTVADRDAALHQAHQRHDALATAHDELTHRLDEVRSTLAEVEARADRERAAAAERQSDLDARLTQEVATRTVLEQTLADTRTAAAETERTLREEVTAVQAQAVDQKAQFDVQLAQEQLEHEHRLADAQQVARQLTAERDDLHTSLATASTQAQQLQVRLATTNRDLATARADADRVPQLQRELEAARAENNRLFDQAGLAMVRCGRDGALLQANRASATLLGRRTLDDVRGAQFAFAVFEAPTVLAWLIDQCVNARTKESVETTWRRKDGGRVFVRLSARSIATDVIEIVAEDLTRVRVLQERLGQAHRMEAVGRFAAEVAVTCSTLLDTIYQKGREWLAVATANAESRREGELLLDEIGRAASLVRQLGACGDEQTRTPMLVDLNTLLHDLEPVLERVAGGNVDIRLRDTSSPLNVDLGTDQIERLLVNVAGYARDRMPSGGQLRVELGTVVVNRRFVDRHPNVRLGLHALITVTEVRRTASVADARPSTQGTPVQRTTARPASASRPGFDFGTIQGLVSDCGGHLWIKVQPQGEMVTKIRLPLVNPYAQSQPRPVAARSKRVASHFTKFVKQS